jgi:hypothetical protein
MEPIFGLPVIVMLLYYVGVFYWTERKQETDKGERNNPKTIRMEREKNILIPLVLLTDLEWIF